MRQVTIPVHPLTRRVLLCEYGAEPIIFPSQDFIFQLLSSAPGRDRAPQLGLKLRSSITMMVDDSIARGLLSHGRTIGLRLFRFHLQVICRYADASRKSTGRVSVKAAIEHWLQVHGVDEDEYSAETAYKCWQRWGWKIEKKNREFLGRLRGKSAKKTSQKLYVRANSAPAPKWNMKQCDIEMAAARFTAALTERLLHPPALLKKHARIYYYVYYGGISQRETARRLGVSRNAANNAVKSMRLRAERNITIAKLLNEAVQCALPEPA